MTNTNNVRPFEEWKTRLSFEQWMDVFANVEEINKDLKHEGLEEEPLEVVWLEGNSSNESEYVIASGCEVIEDGFNSEYEAQTRLDEMESKYYEYVEEEKRKYEEFKKREENK